MEGARLTRIDFGGRTRNCSAVRRDGAERIGMEYD